MKGQYITLESIIFFAIGILIVIMVYSLFEDINRIIEKNITGTQLKSVGSLITGSIVNVFEASNRTGSEVYYNLTIPDKVSRCIYLIFVTPGKRLRLECVYDRGINAEFDLYNFNIDAKNILYSTRGSITILSKEGVVELL